MSSLNAIPSFFKEALATYASFLERHGDAVDANAFLQQLNIAVIVPIGHDHVEFQIGQGVNRLRKGLDTLSASYADRDGAEVSQILHFVNGRLCFEERFRSAGGDLIDEYPRPDLLTNFEIN
ncbi:MAG: hypothetical protein NVS3B16_10430 [Vulcanimicrobiaceae bacterium]